MGGGGPRPNWCYFNASFRPGIFRARSRRRVVFPLAVTAGLGAEQLAALLRDCQPATFGRAGEDVFDEDYRKASKLDVSAFSSSLCPYGLGIVDTVAEMLMPSDYMAGGSRGVKAELYKLNVYSGPSGHFKAHVDTPRSEQQFGSLVLCLPTVHVGGALVVRHSGQTIRHDWDIGTGLNGGDAGPPALQWAAFYSDCEHEVLEVTAGHRVTLTYNLYSVPQRVDVKGKTESMDVVRLPLYGALRDAIGNPLFLTTGSIVGYYCRHAYPHSVKSQKNAPLFPSVLKGVDLSFYKVLTVLGMKVSVRQALSPEKKYLKRYEYFKNKASANQGTVADPMKALVTESYVSKISDVKITRAGGNESHTEEDVLKVFGVCHNIFWINQSHPSAQQKGFVHLTYGNGAGINHLYTSVVMLFKVKEWEGEKRTVTAM
ncbi:hypothetical protein CMQ_2743 [Grosmannia clavigera kw1407]|uniref:Fe2OG dioxygenase domain-containing protein n=1 Tax=Grosmannia clavigera (strain kw1407 / UAMH 11150) TaxID=655863 RepID=F0XH70_GROCL|nr:uncharacterized protein CMQ_2743 [Grosmannia clavigera kw1407]EFX02814.1 hypothetical protein CMQ_2743 [Grosmannia clavigera kw1407]